MLTSNDIEMLEIVLSQIFTLMFVIYWWSFLEELTGSVFLRMLISGHIGISALAYSWLSPLGVGGTGWVPLGYILSIKTGSVESR